jgi:hypothetical protein
MEAILRDKEDEALERSDFQAAVAFDISLSLVNRLQTLCAAASVGVMG